MDFTDYLPKPSLIQSLDVSHILSKHFGSLFLSDSVDPEIIENLKVSQGSTDESHRNYVAKLIKVTSEREQLYERTQQLRNHIFTARDLSLKDDMINQEENKDFAYLNLPPAESTFYKYIDNDLLRANGLIAPQDVILTMIGNDDRVNYDSSPGMTMGSDKIPRRNSAQDLRSRSANKMSEYRLPPLDRPKSSEKPKKTKEGKKLKAPDMILAIEREEDKCMLESLAAKNNYLKNPRHLVPSNKGQSKDWLIKSNCKEESPRMFLPIPEFIEFSDYEIGKVYEKVINFRNITTVLRNIRVLPPKSRYFSLGLGQFPGEKGLVAAGMSCQYAIRFSPDSLGDFEDEITVETQGGNSFPVNLRSRRPRPSLTGGLVWDMGHSLVYGVKVVHYTVKNRGGHGRFCLVDSSIWPVSNPKSFIANKQMILEPFILRPSWFELQTDETVTFELLFCPTDIGVVEREFLVLCDNCHMQTFKIKGEGELASIVMENIEDGLSFPEIGESTDVSAQMLVKFGDLNPFTYCQKILVLKNESHTEIPFCWKIIKPNLKVPALENEDSGLNVVQNRILDFDSAFLIEPPFGVFPPNDSLAFTITFAPLEVKTNHSVLHLVLQGIPDIKTEPTPNPEATQDMCQKQKSLIQISEDSFPDTQPNSLCSNSQKKYISLNDVTSLEIEVKGLCIPLDVSLNPPAIIIAGDLLIDTPVRRQLQIMNKSMCPVNVNWQHSDFGNHIFVVEPQLGMIEPGEIGVVDVCLVSSRPGFVRDTLTCVVDNLDTPLQLVVEAKFKGPEIEIDQTNLDFGLVQAKDIVHRNLKIINKSSINCNWRARIGGSDDIDLFDEIKLSPQFGLLAPLQNQMISISLCCPIAKSIACGLEVALEHGSTRYLNLLACVQSPQVVLRNSSLNISGKLFVNVASTFEIQLCNHSHLVSKFDWLPVVGSQSDMVSVIVDPPRGVIEPKSEFNLKLIVTCSDLIEIDDIIVPCAIEGMADPVLLQITGKVQGPNLICSVMESPESEKRNSDLKIDFGDEIELFQDVKKYICIENSTSIVTNYCLSVDYFIAASDEVEASQDRSKIRPNLADRQSKPDKLAHYDFCKNMLAHKNGLAVGFTPVRGTLAGYEKIVITVCVYNDMWGKYNDVIKITGSSQHLEIEPISIPITITVKGIPIEFTMTSGRKEQKPILRLGSKPLGHELLSRRVRLNNKSPCDLYINWEMYSMSDESDDKILDLILNCGDPFPIGSDSLQCPDSMRFTDVNESLASGSTRLLTDRVLNIISDSSREEGGEEEPLVRVVIRPHDGVISGQPISFDPPQLMIASESFGFVTITFDPRNPSASHNLPWDHNHGISFDNYLLGFVSLTEKDLRKPGIMVRKHQYAIDQVKLDITGRILKPSLQIEYQDDEEEVQFKVPFSSLLDTKSGFNLLKSMTFTKSVTIRNLKDTEIMFSLKTRSPFEVTNSKLCDGAVLGIGDVVKIDIKFTLDKRQLSLLSDQSLFDSDESKCLRLERQAIPDFPGRSVKTAVFRDVVSINYDHTTLDQLIPLRATICFPEFTLSKSEINFDTCFIGETCTEYFRILNKSQCSLVVFLRLDCGSDSVFGISEEEFVIPYKELETNTNQCTVSVCFTPRQAAQYSATIVISGIMGEEQCLIPVRGSGSYDNQYQRKY